MLRLRTHPNLFTVTYPDNLRKIKFEMTDDNNDQIHRFMFDDADIRGEVVSLKDSFQNACVQQNLPPVAQKLLGEFLATACLLGEVLKFAGTITIQARGNGPIPLIMADITHSRNLRGIARVSEEVDTSTLEGQTLAQLVGNGVLTLIMDPEKGERYQGIIELVGTTLADCLTHYFTQSEQLPTRLWLFSDLTQAGGILLQSLPPRNSISGSNSGLNSESNLESNSDSLELWRTATQLASTAEAEDMFTLNHASLLTRLFGGEFTVRLFEPSKLQFACQCSRERCAHTIASLGKNEAASILEEREQIEITCEFCGTCYTFNSLQVDAIFTPEEPEQHQTLH